MRPLARYLWRLDQLGPALREGGAVLSGEAGAHVHLAAATRSAPGAEPHYATLVPRRVEALLPAGCEAIAGVERDPRAVAASLAHSLDLFTAAVSLPGGHELPVLKREAVLAELLADGGLALGLAGMLIRLANTPPVDVDEVREILKSACLGHCFQPLLELLDVA